MSAPRVHRRPRVACVERARAPARGASSERCGCHCVQAASSAAIATATATPTASAEPRAPTRQAVRARRRSPGAGATARGRGPARRVALHALQRAAPGEPAGAQQRHARVAGHVPGPVDERVHAEHDHEAEHAQQADALGRVATGARSCRRCPAGRRRAESPRAHRPAAVERMRRAPGRRHPRDSSASASASPTSRGRRASARRSRARA